MLVASVGNQSVGVENPADNPETNVPVEEAVVEIAVETPVKVSKTVKEIVSEYFSDHPVLADIAYCESGFKQFNADGTVIRGKVNAQDVGVMQINEKYHLDAAKKLGLDIYTLEGNMAYAKHLYKTFGTKPWNYSSECWNKSREVALLK